jgi:predicted glycosyltransferase
MPFIKAIITPNFFRENLGKKQIRVECFKELSYLHPNYYTPNINIYKYLGINKEDQFVLLRFNAFDAVHDIGITGISKNDKLNLVKRLEKYFTIFISSEDKIQPELESYILKTPKSRIHDVLYYAKLFVCDTQTMATEAAILGTPVIRSNSFVGPTDMGNFIELEKRYGLMFNIKDLQMVIKKAEELIQKPDLKKEWQAKREILLTDKCDITKLMVCFIENYPISIKELKKDLNAFILKSKTYDIS